MRPAVGQVDFLGGDGLVARAVSADGVGMVTGTKNKGFGYESSRMLKDEWLTPPYILKALGDFDLDPCAPVKRPWETAKLHYTIEDNGLTKPWAGRVWCNPPYGNMAAMWMRRLADHGDGIALLFARTETGMWFEEIWPKASAILFIAGRIKFYHVTGEEADSAGAPSALIAYGRENARILQESGIKGAFVRCGAGTVVGG